MTNDLQMIIDEQEIVIAELTERIERVEADLSYYAPSFGENNPLSHPSLYPGAYPVGFTTTYSSPTRQQEREMLREEQQRQMQSMKNIDPRIFPRKLYPRGTSD